MRRWLLVAALALPVVEGCSWTFDSSPPELPLLGSPPDLSAFRRLNGSKLSYGEAIVYGADNHHWLAMTTARSEKGITGIALERLFPPASCDTMGTCDGIETIDASLPILTKWRAFYLREYTADRKAIQLRVHHAGQSGRDNEFFFPPGEAMLLSGGDDDVFVYWVRDKETSTYSIVQVDHSFSRTLRLPYGLDPERPDDKGLLFFNWDGTYFFTLDAEGRMVVHATREEHDVDLGLLLPHTIDPKTQRPVLTNGPQPRFAIDDTYQRLLILGEEGLRALPYDGSPAKVLEAAPCETDLFFFYRGHVIYRVGQQVRRVKLSGVAPPEVVAEHGVERILGFDPDGQLVFSRDPGNRYIHGSGDGWLGNWRFMERGLNVSFNYEGSRVHWLEHTAQTSGSGDLYAASVPLGAPELLARNVHQFSELEDGRILALANRAFLGVQNRLIVIDERDHNARWVADAVRAYIHIPGSTDVLVDTVSGASGRDVIRVPVPPAEAP